MASNPQIKVDFNTADRPEAEVHEAGYYYWPITGAESLSANIDEVIVTLTRYGNQGTNLRSDWYKAGIQAPYYARLVNDDLTVEEGHNGAAFAITFEGLSAATHTIATKSTPLSTPLKIPIVPLLVKFGDRVCLMLNGKKSLLSGL